MHIQQALVHLDIVVQHLPISRHIKPSTGKFVSKEFQVLIIVHLSRILVDQAGTVLTAELVQLQHVQLTQLIKLIFKATEIIKVYSITMIRKKMMT